ncbi:MAG: Gfo/Idh/MocA family oxidoreductase [Dehalococcoidia bacterium]|nr:Gfo/Idh/MocA family oxidoreductase [Dehalococcoidia bacterium]
MPIGWGIIGPGGWADRYIAPAIKQAKDSKLVAVLSRDKERADVFAKGHGADRGYDSLAEFLKHPGLDAVWVGVPNNLHAANAIPAMDAGKHVMVDITMAVTEEDCQAMVEAGKRNKVKLGVEFQTRHHPGNRELKRLITEGILGDLIMLRAQMSLPWGGGQVSGVQQWKVSANAALAHPDHSWKEVYPMRGGGVTVVGGMFAVDLLRFLAGRDVEQVYAYTDAATAPRGQETLANAILQFQGGVPAFMDCSSRNPYSDNNVTVYGTKGRATSIGGLRLDSEGAVEVVTDRGNIRKEFSGHNMYADEFEEFMRCIRENKEPSASGVDGWRERQINIAIVESSRKNAPVHIKL